MPVFDNTTVTKIAELRAIREAGGQVEVQEVIKIEWPSPDGTLYYGVQATDQTASVPPTFTVIPRIIADSDGAEVFMPVSLDASIGDEEIDITFEDLDEAVADLMQTHGEGVRATLIYWFPQAELELPFWFGHLEYGSDESELSITIKAVQGFRSAEANVPGGGHYQFCSAVFGGLLATQAQIDAGACPHNKHIGGLIGINDPSTSQPWTYCDRLSILSCINRGVNPLYHLSHRTIERTVQNNQTSGPNLLSTSQGNETGLEEAVRVVMGRRRIYGARLLAYRRDLNNNHPDLGFFLGQYEFCRGPSKSLTQMRFKVGNEEKPADPYHLNYRLGEKGQSAYPADNWQLTPHGYSLVVHAKYNFGQLNPAEVDPADATGSGLVEGLNNIRVYTDADTYTETYTTNRVWQLLHIMTDKVWGYGLDHSRFNIDSWIEAADWCEQYVTFTDTFGSEWAHIRSESNVELIGRKVQQQVDDMCMAGRLSRPFIFNGQIHIVPLRALTEEELAAAPVFRDTGDENAPPNIVIEDDGMSTVRIGERLSVKDLPNRIECTYDDAVQDWQKVPLRPIEDHDAQLAAGRLVGDGTLKVNKKEYHLLGVTNEAQATKLAWTLLDLGPHDEGGLQNNLPISFDAWYLDTLDLHLDKVIKVESAKLTKYGFDYFRVKNIKRGEGLICEITAQAYAADYIEALEVDTTPVEPVYCDIDTDCPPGFVCVGGRCVIEPDPCRTGFGTVTYVDGILTVPVEPC